MATSNSPVRVAVPPTQPHEENAASKFAKVLATLEQPFARIQVHLDQDIFGDMRLTVKDIEKYTLLLNEEGSQHLQSLAQNASYVVAEFLKNLIGLHGRLELTELAKKVVEDPDLVLDAEPNQWDSTQIDIKTRDFKLLLAVLMYANTDEREERRLRRTAQRLFQASQKANRQIAIRTLDSIGFFDSGCDSNPDSGYRFSSGSLKIEDAAPPSYRLNDYVPPLLEKCSGNAVKIQKWCFLWLAPVLPRAPRFNPIPDRFLIELDRRSVDPFYYERIRKLKASWPTIALDGLEFTPKTVITALTSYYRYVLTPKGTKIGVSKWYSAEVQYESIPETQWPVRSWWKPNLSKVQKQLVHSLQQMLEEKDPQPLFWSWSVSRISLKKDEMRVVFKKTPRDVCQPKEAYSRAVLAPSPGTPGPLAAPPPQLPEARPTEYTSKQHFILLPKSVSGSEIVDLRAKWVKCNG